MLWTSCTNILIYESSSACRKQNSVSCLLNWYLKCSKSRNRVVTHELIAALIGCNGTDTHYHYGSYIISSKSKVHCNPLLALILNCFFFITDRIIIFFSFLKLTISLRGKDFLINWILLNLNSLLVFSKAKHFSNKLNFAFANLGHYLVIPV